MANLYRIKYLKIGIRNLVVFLISLAICSARLITTESALVTANSSRLNLPISTEEIPTSEQTSSKPLTNRGSTKFLSTLTTVQPTISTQTEDSFIVSENQISLNDNRLTSIEHKVDGNKNTTSRPVKSRESKSHRKHVEDGAKLVQDVSPTSQPVIVLDRNQNETKVNKSTSIPTTRTSRRRTTSTTLAPSTKRPSPESPTTNNVNTVKHVEPTAQPTTVKIGRRLKTSSSSTTNSPSTSTLKSPIENQTVEEAYESYTTDSSDQIEFTSTSPESYHFDLSK